MAMFNKKQTTRVKLGRSFAAKNRAGGLAFRRNAKTELTLCAVTAMMQTDDYHQSVPDADREFNHTITMVLRKDPIYALKLAHFCRTELHLRSLSIWLLARYATSGAHIPNTRHYVTDMVQHPDDITELIAACFTITHSQNGKNRLPIYIKNGLKSAFNKFNVSQFAKSSRDGKVKLRDALFLCHPKAKDAAQQKIFDQIAAGTLPPANTWEVATCGKGSTKETWDAIIPRMEHMAVLTQLRKLLLVGADLDPVIEKLTDKEAVLREQQFPFKYLTAFRAIEDAEYTFRENFRGLSNAECVFRKNYDAYLDGASRVKDALQAAMDLSIANVPKLKGRTLVLIDNSDSMSKNEANENLSRKKDTIDEIPLKAADIASLFGALSAAVCDRYAVRVFGTRHKHVAISLRDGLLASAEKIRNIDVDHSTYAHLPIIDAMEKGLIFDRIIIFSDMQCYNELCNTNTKQRSVAEAFLDYQRRVNPKAYLHCVDLAGFGTALLPENTRNVCLLRGWSERIFDFINMFESNTQSLVETIEIYNS